MERCTTVEELKKEKPNEKSNKCAEVFVCMSDDEADVVDVTMAQEMEQMEAAVTEQRAEVAVAMGNQENALHESDALLSFIRQCCPSLPPNFSPSHPKDLIQACQQTAYSLYLYVGVALGTGRSTGVILIGYFDQTSELSVVKLLDTLQLSADAVDPAVDIDTEASTNTCAADTDARLLIEKLKKFSLPLSNLCAFYCNAPHPTVSRVFESQLQAFSPSLVSLCGLPGIAGRACQAGLLASFRCVVDLIRSLHQYITIRPSVNHRLKAMFTNAESYNPSHPVCEQALFIISTVQKMASSWKDIMRYFNSVRQVADAHHIRSQLMDHKVKLRFLFLAQTLEPLRALQELQQNGTVDVATQLQLTSIMVRSYATNLLQPSAIECFLTKWDLQILHNEQELLPALDVDIRFNARKFLFVTSMADLGEQDRSDFLKDAVKFYKAALESLVTSIPGNLGELALLNIYKVLKHLENINVRRILFFNLTPLCFPIGYDF